MKKEGSAIKALVFFGVFGLSVAGHASPLKCQDIFNEGSKLSSAEFKELVAANGNLLKSATVEVTSVTRNETGGSSYVLTRTGASWNSGYSEFYNAPQGEPRWVFNQLGRATAEYFGFKILSSEQMMAPDAVTLNSKLARINSKLPVEQQIGAGFFNTDPTDNRVGPTYFLKRFAEEGLTPLATQGTTSVHDISYHLAVIALPQKIFHQIRIMGKLYLDFADFARPILEKEFGLRGRKAVSQVMSNLSQHIDATLGNIGGQLGKRNERFKHEMSNEFVQLLRVNASPADLLVNSADQAFAYAGGRAISDLIKKFGNQTEEIKKRTVELAKQYASQPQVMASIYGKNFDYSPQELTETTLANILTINNVVEKMNETP